MNSTDYKQVRSITYLEAFIFNQLFDTINDKDIFFIIDESNVTGVKPSVLVNSLSSLVDLLIVT